MLRLNWGEIGADNLRVRKVVAHLDRPVANARGHVEDGPRRRLLRQWRKEKPVIEEFPESLGL